MEIKVEREEPAPPPVKSITLTVSEDELRSIRQALYSADWIDIHAAEEMFRKVVRVMNEEGIPRV